MLPPHPPKNYKISSAFSYNFKLALTGNGSAKNANIVARNTALFESFDKFFSEE